MVPGYSCMFLTVPIFRVVQNLWGASVYGSIILLIAANHLGPLGRTLGGGLRFDDATMGRPVGVRRSGMTIRARNRISV